LIAAGLSVLITVRGMRRNSLDFSGGMLSIAMGFLLTIASAAFCVSVIVFYLSSSRLTKWKSEEKRKIEADFKEGGQRNWLQVLCNGGIGSVCALLYLYTSGVGELPINLTGPKMDAATVFSLGYLSSLSCSGGDTWASEVGSAIGGTPRLITTFRQVPRGTNGGVTMIGLVCSLAGGLVVGISYYIALLFFSISKSCTPQWMVIVVAGLSGLIGSLIDSILGATIQYSGYCTEINKVVNSPGAGVKHISGFNLVGNHAVNFLSALFTALLVLCVTRFIIVCY